MGPALGVRLVASDFAPAPVHRAGTGSGPKTLTVRTTHLRVISVIRGLVFSGPQPHPAPRRAEGHHLMALAKAGG